MLQLERREMGSLMVRLLLLLVLIGWSPALAQTTAKPDRGTALRTPSSNQPGIQRTIVQPQTPAERDAFIKRRIREGRRTPDEVKPFPAQQISPEAAQRQSRQ
jgi:hypothetical protein